MKEKSLKEIGMLQMVVRLHISFPQNPTTTIHYIVKNCYTSK